MIPGDHYQAPPLLPLLTQCNRFKGISNALAIARTLRYHKRVTQESSKRAPISWLEPNSAKRLVDVFQTNISPSSMHLIRKG